MRQVFQVPMETCWIHASTSLIDPVERASQRTRSLRQMRQTGAESRPEEMGRRFG
jgi:hypothetical protein